MHDVKTAIDDNELALVHTHGQASTEEVFTDEDFNIKVDNSYRMNRKCEMLQWVETSTKQDDRMIYNYTKEWKSVKISSLMFNQASAHENPTVEWPFESKTWSAEKCELNCFRLNSSQVSRLGKNVNKPYDTETVDTTITATTEKMTNAGFAVFKSTGTQYLFSSTEGSKWNNSDLDQVGTYRVSFEQAECTEATVIAQQIANRDSLITFRKWNPKKLLVPYGTETSADSDKPCINNMFLCCICICVNKIMNFALEEVVDGCRDGYLTFEQFFAEEDLKVKSLENVVRPCGICGHILGWFMLFIPIITLLKFIPLVGTLLGFAATVAAGIFSFVFGGTIAVLILGLAWLVFRPLFGISLLTLVGISSYFIFFYQSKGSSGSI